MARKLFKTGNSVVVSLPVDVLEAVGLNLGDEVSVVADIERLRILVIPSTPPGLRPDSLEKVDEFIDRYQPALDKLAREKLLEILQKAPDVEPGEHDRL